jgi:hypothetical protein
MSPIALLVRQTRDIPGPGGRRSDRAGCAFNPDSGAEVVFGAHARRSTPDHRPTKERQWHCRRYLRTGERLRHGNRGRGRSSTAWRASTTLIGGTPRRAGSGRPSTAGATGPHMSRPARTCETAAARNCMAGKGQGFRSPAEVALRPSFGSISLLGCAVGGGGLALFEMGGAMGSVGWGGLVGRSGLGFLEVDGGLALFEAGGGLGSGADSGSVGGVGACCAKEVPSTPIAGDDASVMPRRGWAPRGREGADAAGDSIGTGVEEPGGNSNGGSGGKAGALVRGGAAKRSPPPTTVPGSVEWIGSSMSAIAAARPAARMTTMLS